MFAMLNKYFNLDARKTRPGTEILAGIVTFTAMSYIIFVQPQIMSGNMFGMDTGMPFGALVTTTCLAAAFGSILMGLLANYPIGLAPGMGENFFFVFSILPLSAGVLGAKLGEAEVWRLGLGVVFISGVIFAILTVFNIRKLLLNAVSPSLKAGIAAGIGLFIAFIGLQNAGIVVIANKTISMTHSICSPEVAIFTIGLIAIVVLHIYKVKGSILWGILIAAAAAICFGRVHFENPFSLPKNPMPIFAKMDLVNIWKYIIKLLPVIIILTFMDVFDTMGTLIGVATQAKLMKNDKLPNANRAFASDAGGTLFGALCGHSTVTCYIESITGVESGGRTGLAAVITGICFLLAMFFAPFVEMVANCTAITAPALVVVGALMMQSFKAINWEDYSESIPAFLIIIGIPLCFNIADGMMLGFILYPIIKLISGKGREIGWLTYLLGAVLLLYMIFIKSGLFSF